MEEQQTSAPTEEVSTAADAQPADVSQAPEAPPAPDWRTLINDVDPTELRKHPRFAGIVGSEIDRALKKREAEMSAETRRKLEAEQDDEIARLLEENDETLTTRYPKARERLQSLREARSQSQIQQQLNEARNEVARLVGQGYTSLPEWAEVANSDDYASMIASLQTLPPEQQVLTFTQKATQLLAARMTAKQFAKWQKDELAKVREVIRQEEAAKLLSNTPSPDTKRASGLPPKLDISRMSDKEFEDYWNKEIKR